MVSRLENGGVMGKFGFAKPSWKRALGISSLKGKISREIGIPLTKSGREKKFGRLGAKYVWTLGLMTGRAVKQDEGSPFEYAYQTAPRQSFLGAVVSAVFRLLVLAVALVCFTLAWGVHSGGGTADGMWFLVALGGVCLLIVLRRSKVDRRA
jgi:hypothetical protein